MALYEHVFLARQDISGQQAEALAEQFKGVVESNGGKVAKVENWGLRNTAYRINKNRKAHYVLMNIDAESAAVSEMERQMRLHDDVLRYITLRVEEHEEGPSAILRKSDRDDRGERGDRGDRPDRGDRGDRGPRRDRDDRPPRRFEPSARNDAV